jgi:lysophospholipase L1-like esterase
MKSCLVTLFLLLTAFPAAAAHYKVFLLTGQSNSLGTTNGTEADLSPGSDPADSRIKFFWHNVADAATSLGTSGGAFTPLQAQQGNYYPGSSTHWGPEFGFGRTLVRAGVENVAIIKASRGGGGNTHWSESAGGHMYSHLVATVNAATATLTANGDTFEITGLLYLQGESDSTAEADIAGTRLQELVDNLRADLPNAANLKAVIGGIAAAGTARDTVRARHQTLGAASPSIDFFPNLDLQSQVTDGLHFNKAAKLRIGERFAQAFFANGTVARRYGKLVFIGDSITQGGNGDRPGYRYQVFKRLAEQGVPIDPVNGYQFTGSVTGPQTTPLLTTPDVNGQAFENVHDGHYGWRASWINARVRLPANRRSNNRGEGSLLNWTGQAQPQAYDISGPDLTVAYPDPTASGTGNSGTTYVPDTVSVMIGINDLGDDNLSANQVVADLGTIIDQLRAANPNVRLFLNRLLHTNQTQAMRDAVDAVNAQLAALASAKNAAAATSPLWIIDANTGFIPATMTYDAVHPNAAGEAHVGDRIAAALGVIESPVAAATAPLPNEEKASADLNSRFEGNEIWNGSAYLNGWAQFNELTESLPEATDLRLIHPSTNGRWLEGTNAGWSALSAGSWTFETRLKCNANANGFVLWLGTGTQRIIVEVHGNRTQDFGATSFNVAHNNLDGNFHVFRVTHDAANARYHVFRDNIRLTPLDGATYDQSGADNRLILGDYTTATFGNAFDITLDHVRFGPGAWLPPGLDSDLNGMTDAWEYRYFAVVTGTNPAGNPDEDAFTNLQEFQNSTDPVVADAAPVTLRTFLMTGGGNARGFPSATALNSPAPGNHPAEQAGGVWFNDGSDWTTLAAAADGTFGPEIAFARLLWDAGHRGFGIVKSTTIGGGNSLWQKGSPDDSAYAALVATATAAAATPPAGFDSVNFTALLHVKGEGNDATEASAADTRFATLLDNLKADLPAASGLRGILGEIGGSGANRDTTRSRHSTLAAARTDIGIARATGLAVHNLDGQGIHYGADSLFLLGTRMASEVLDLGLGGAPPLPSWSTLHAWFVADSGVAFDSSSAVTRWANLRNGSATRDLSRRVAGQVFRRNVTAANGRSRKVMRFDGSNDLWSNATTEFGALGGARSVALLCRVTSPGDGFLFDGSTGSGRTRAQIRGGLWQAGVSATADAWNGPEPDSAARQTGTWQQHVFTYTPNGSGGTNVVHWIDGNAVATFTDTTTTNLGGLILGSNGGSPFARLAVEIAELAVFSSALGGSEVTQLKAAWDTRWGTPAGPPFSVAVSQTPREIPRFGRHGLLEIAIDSESGGSTTLDELRILLFPGTRTALASVSLLSADGGTELARIDSPTTDELVFTPAFPLAEGTNPLQLAIIPARHAPLGSTLDASVSKLTFSGTQSGEIIPDPADPPGSLTLGLVPLFTDVVQSGDLGINTFRIPGITIDRQGILHAVYDHRYAGGADLPANVDVGYSRSTDGGATWSTSQVIMDYDTLAPGSSGNGVGDPCILHDPVTDTLWVAALWSFGNNGYNGSGPGTAPADTGQYVLAKSEDGGDTWSAPINITAAVKDDVNWNLIFQGPGHGLALRNGTLVFPSQYRDATGTVRVCSVFSSDHGVTWDFGSGVPTASPQTNENTACELDDGRLLFSMRTPSGSNGQRAWIRYTPGGTTSMRNGTWDPLFRLPSVPDPVCQGSVIQWTSTHRGDPREFIVFGNPASSSSRVNFTLRVSPDGGDTWPVSRLLYAGSGAYSSICILPDRSIGVLFEKDNYTRITFARVEEAWLLNPAADADSDGMPDAWETLHGLNAALNDSAADPDGDGESNSEEQAAGTDPLNTASALGITSLTGSALTWRSIPGRSYRIEESSGLSSWQTIPGMGAVHATGATSTANVSASPARSRFFRVRALP